MHCIATGGPACSRRSPRKSRRPSRAHTCAIQLVAAAALRRPRALLRPKPQHAHADHGPMLRGESRCRCGRGEPSPGADVAGVRPVPVQMGQCCEASPGADVAGARPVPVQMWQGRAPLVPVQMWAGASAVPVQMWAGASPFSPGADVGAAYARWFSVFVFRGASASTCPPNAFEWSLPRGRATRPNNRHANAPSARSSAGTGAVHTCAGTGVPWGSRRSRWSTRRACGTRTRGCAAPAASEGVSALL